MEPLQSGDPTSLGPYRLEGRLGAGGMGEVYAARSPGGRRIAIKVIRAEYATDPTFRQRFAREVEAARKVGGFHTAQIVAADPEADRPWMATAYIDGPSLLDLVRTHGPLPVEHCMILARELAEGIAAIHERGLVHRDLKPSNVLMAPDGARIIDFGIARAAGESSLTSAGVAVGTFAYMSPEQVAAREVGPATDVFSLGALLTYAATGHGPFDAESIPAITHKIITQEPDLDGLYGALRRVIAGCLAKSPEVRPTAEAALLMLQANTAETEIETAPEAAVPEALSLAVAASAQNPEQGDGITLTAPGGSGVERSHAGTAGAASSRSGGSKRGGRRSLWGPTGRLRPKHRVLRHPLVIAAICLTVIVAVGIPLLVTTENGQKTPTRSDIVTGTLAATLTDSSMRQVQATEFVPGTKTLAVGDENGSIYLWNTDTGTLSATLSQPNHSGGVESMSFAPDSTTLATGSDLGRVYLWNTASGTLTATLADPNDDPHYPNQPTIVFSVAFAPASPILAAADSAGYIYIWNTATGTRKATLAVPGVNRQSLGVASYGMAWGADGTTLVETHGGGQVDLWNTATGTLSGAFDLPNSASTIALAPDGKTLVAEGKGNKMFVFDVTTRKITATFTDPDQSPLGDAAFAPGSSTSLALNRGDGKTYLWNIATGKITTTLTDPGRPFSDNTDWGGPVAFTANGGTLAVGTAGTVGLQDNPKIYLWHISEHS